MFYHSAVFYECVTEWIDEDSAVDVAYLDFRKAIDTVSQNILIGSMLKKCGLEEQKVR